MSLLASLLLLQAAPVVDQAPQRNPELDAANDCLVAGTRQWLEDKSGVPDDKERWRWAQVIVGRCEEKVAASVATPASDDEMSSVIRREGGISSISRYDLRRSEALYYVDGMIRAHFEKDAE